MSAAMSAEVASWLKVCIQISFRKDRSECGTFGAHEILSKHFDSEEYQRKGDKTCYSFPLRLECVGSHRKSRLPVFVEQSEPEQQNVSQW